MPKHTLKAIFTLAIISFFFSSKLKAEDTIRTKDIVVSASKIEISYSESTKIIYKLKLEDLLTHQSNSLSDMLKYIPSVDVRSRGDFGVQSDISIGTGTYEQTLVLLDGIPMNDAQTGHHNMDLPLDISDIRKIEVLDGASSRILGANAFAGAVNILTEDFHSVQENFGIIGGDHGYYKFYLNAQIPTWDVLHYISASKSQSDGYTTNTDYNIKNFFYKNNIETSFGTFEGYFGYNEKAFGANSFYTAKYPNQYEETGTMLAGVRYFSRKDWKFAGIENLKLASSFFWKRHRDKFQLFRDTSLIPSWYTNHNYHLSNTLNYDLKLSYLSEYGISSLAANFKNEDLKSNVLGYAVTPEEVPFEDGVFFTKGIDRQNLALSFEHLFSYDGFKLSLGSLANWNSAWKWNMSYGFDMNVELMQNMNLLFGVNSSLRYPTFTDLFYSGATNRGNPDLKPEEAINYELALKYNYEEYSLMAKTFFRQGKDLIDWVKPAPDSVWTTMNLTNLDTRGFSLMANWNNDKTNSTFYFKSIGIAYTYLDASKDGGDFITYYNLNHLKHKLNSEVTFQVFKNIQFDFRFMYKFRNGSFYDDLNKKDIKYGNPFISDLAIRYKFGVIAFFGQLNNAFDSKYYDFANIASQGRSFRLGVELYELGKGFREPVTGF